MQESVYLSIYQHQSLYGEPVCVQGLRVESAALVIDGTHTLSDMGYIVKLTSDKNLRQQVRI